jgi:hypothetical protein
LFELSKAIKIYQENKMLTLSELYYDLADKNVPQIQGQYIMLSQYIPVKQYEPQVVGCCALGGLFIELASDEYLSSLSFYEKSNQSYISNWLNGLKYSEETQHIYKALKQTALYLPYIYRAPSRNSTIEESLVFMNDELQMSFWEIAEVLHQAELDGRIIYE